MLHIFSIPPKISFVLLSITLRAPFQRVPQGARRAKYYIVVDYEGKKLQGCGRGARAANREHCIGYPGPNGATFRLRRNTICSHFRVLFDFFGQINQISLRYFKHYLNT